MAAPLQIRWSNHITIVENLQAKAVFTKLHRSAKFLHF